MALAVKIDELGFYIQGSDLSDYKGEETETIILTPIPGGFWHPRWTGDRWIEGLNPQEIAQRSGLPQTLPEAKLYIQQQIIDLAAQKQRSLVAGYDDVERETWDTKQKEALAFLETGDISNAKYLRIEAAALTGATDPVHIQAVTQALAKIILAKADELLSASVAIAGTRKRKSAFVEALADIQQVLEYSVNEGWPI